MTRAEVETYLAGLDEPARTTLERLRATILDVAPDAEECISYGSPAFRVGGKVVAGFAAARHHLSYLPHSGTVIASLGDALDGYETSKGALKFGPNTDLPRSLVAKLIDARRRELDQ